MGEEGVGGRWCGSEYFSFPVFKRDMKIFKFEEARTRVQSTFFNRVFAGKFFVNNRCAPNYFKKLVGGGEKADAWLRFGFLDILTIPENKLHNLTHSKAINLPLNYYCSPEKRRKKTGTDSKILVKQKLLQFFNVRSSAVRHILFLFFGTTVKHLFGCLREAP